LFSTFFKIFIIPYLFYFFCSLFFSARRCARNCVLAYRELRAWTWFIRYVLLNLQLLNNIIINKSQVLLPQALMTFTNIGYPVYALLFYCSKNLKLFRFPIFRFLAYLIKVIPETCRVY
jgi:hypothetical protein